jgi:hypothetical protein
MRAGRGLWEEKLRQHWFETELGMTVFRWIHHEMVHDADSAFDRWRRLATLPSVQRWTPPPGLEIVRRR